MSTVYPTRPGQSQLTSEQKALFLRVFSGETLSTFENDTVMKALHRVLTISKGKGATFPVLGQLGAAYHSPGAFLDGNSANSKLQTTEKFIGVDNLLVAHVYMSNFDEAMQQMDMRGMYSAEMGKALAREFDKRTLRVAINAARQPAALSGINPATGAAYFGGAKVSMGSSSTLENLRECFLSAAQTFDEKNIGPERTAVLRPTEYWLFFRTAQTAGAVGVLSNINKDVGGAGSLAKGQIMEFAGFNIVKTNNMPSTNISATDAKEGVAGTSGTENVRVPVSGETVPNPSVYTGNFTNTRGLFLNPEAIGTVKLLDVRTEEDYQLERKATLLTADYLMGHGVLRAEAAIELEAGGTNGAVTQS